MSAAGPVACLGLGYVASRFARLAVRKGVAVRGTTGDAALRRELEGAGVEALPRGRGNEARALEGAAAVVVSAPPGGDGCPVLGRHRPLLAAGGLRWAAYLSSTGVYGDRGGGWVDEDDEPAPSSPRAARRLAAEEAWRRLGEEAGTPVALLRLAGIYGPGRSALDRVRSGRAARIDKPGHAFSRVHADDIARILLAGLGRRAAGVFNVADARPAPQADVVAEACRLLGREVPEAVPFEDARRAMSPGALSFWQDNRRVRSDRVRRELGIELLYPDFRSGLMATLSEEEGAAPASDPTAA